MKPSPRDLAWFLSLSKRDFENQAVLNEVCAIIKEHDRQSWQPIKTAPLDGTWVLLAGPSGYMTTPLRVEVCRYYPEYHSRDPWTNHANDSFRDGGAAPTHWMPLPPPPTTYGCATPGTLSNDYVDL